MARIDITPEQVRQVASQFKTESQQSQQMVSRLQQQINGLQWEGMTSQRFYADFQQWQATMHRFVELLQGIGMELDQIATRFETADRG
jgi:WXG100 family type VII secretion target